MDTLQIMFHLKVIMKLGNDALEQKYLIMYFFISFEKSSSAPIPDH